MKTRLLAVMEGLQDLQRERDDSADAGWEIEDGEWTLWFGHLRTCRVHVRGETLTIYRGDVTARDPLPPLCWTGEDPAAVVRYVREWLDHRRVVLPPRHSEAVSSVEEEETLWPLPTKS